MSPGESFNVLICTANNESLVKEETRMKQIECGCFFLSRRIDSHFIIHEAEWDDIDWGEITDTG